MVVLDKKFEEQQQAFHDWLARLPDETAQDLENLFQQYREETDDVIKSDIAQTIQEILMPDTLNVELQKEFDLGQEDVQVRKRLNEYREKVGQQIAKLRKEASLSQEQLADIAGISQSHVCRLETGVHVPTFETIEKIAKALGVDADQLAPGNPHDA